MHNHGDLLDDRVGVRDRIELDVGGQALGRSETHQDTIGFLLNEVEKKKKSKFSLQKSGQSLF